MFVFTVASKGMNEWLYVQTLFECSLPCQLLFKYSVLFLLSLMSLDVSIIKYSGNYKINTITYYVNLDLINIESSSFKPLFFLLHMCSYFIFSPLMESISKSEDRLINERSSFSNICN